MSQNREHRGRILLAEDDDIVARALARVLEHVGFSVEKVMDGRLAAERMRAQPFDLVLSDIRMPDMDGLALMRAVREHDLDLPVILITGSPDVSTAVQAVEHGALRYLIKPVDNARLLQEVDYGIRIGRLARLKREALSHLGDLGKFVGDRAAIDSRLDAAMAQLAMAYQPIVAWSTRSVYSYEALARSREPSLPHPGALFDAAERTGRIETLGRAIRSAVARDTAATDATIFVNLHPVELMDAELLSGAEALAQQASRVVLEITERASLDRIDGAQARIEGLRRLGYRIAVDDLGAGYAGLTTFAQLQPDFAKLDMSLVRGIDRDLIKQRVVRSMTALCRELNVLVVAEGVETAAERDLLVELGCDLLQGYLFARPGPAFPVPKLEGAA